MDEVDEVIIDSDGVFKYILIELTEMKKRSGSKSKDKTASDSEPPRKMTIVRGFEWAEFHGMTIKLVVCT